MKSVLIIVALCLVTFTAQAKVLEKIYAVVNGEIITLTEIQDYQRKLREGGFVNDLLFAEPSVREKALKDRSFLIDKLIDEKIMDYEVKKNGFVVTADRVNQEIDSIAKKSNITTAQLKASLHQQNLDFVEYQDFVKKSIERRQLIEKEITSKIKVSDQDITSFYLSQHGKTAAQVYEYDISHILLNKDDTAEAERLVNEARSKGNFPLLVEKYSMDEGSKMQGGKFGVFKTGEMIHAIENAITNLNIGDTSNVVQTPMGLHIFKLNDKRMIDDPEIEKQKPQIYQMLFAKAFQEQINFWLSKKRKEAIIQINKS